MSFRVVLVPPCDAAVVNAVERALVQSGLTSEAAMMRVRGRFPWIVDLASRPAFASLTAGDMPPPSSCVIARGT